MGAFSPLPGVPKQADGPKPSMVSAPPPSGRSSRSLAMSISAAHQPDDHQSCSLAGESLATANGWVYWPVDSSRSTGTARVRPVRLRAVTEGYPPRRQRLVEVMVTAIPRVPAAAIWLVTCRFSARHGGRPSARAGSGLPGRVVVGTRAPDGGSGAHGTTPGLDVVVTGLGVAVTGGRDGAGR